MLPVLLGLAASAPAVAEDIELYVNHNVQTDENARVLIVFDTSGSMAFSTLTGNDCGYDNYNRRWILCDDNRLNVAQNAVKNLVNSNKDVDFGLMRFAGSDGGYVLSRIHSNNTKILKAVDNLPADGATPITETLWEAYLYMTGQQIDFADGIQDRDKAVDNNKYYKSPFRNDDKGNKELLRCDNSINVILMTDGDPSNDSDRNSNIKKLHNSIFIDAIPFESGEYKNSYLVALAKILHGTKQTQVDLFSETPDIVDTARVYTIGFGTGMSQGGKDLLDMTARVGGGKYLHADTADELSKALNQTISQIREENSSFTSPSFASNNVDQTRSKNAIYFTMFYPEIGTRWQGNLKKLEVSGNKIVDTKGVKALDSNGLIDKNAHTFWPDADSAADGNAVKQGGVNAALASSSKERKLFSDGPSGQLINFDYDTISEVFNIVNKQKNKPSVDDLLVSYVQLESTINWARGIDVDDEDGDGSSQDKRNDIFGDPLHSKPLAIDYGNNDVRILIGTNAGFLHMFKDDSKNNKVEESWAFIPSALYSILNPLRSKEKGKEYGMDGPISVYFNNKSLNSEGLNDGTINASSGDEVWAIAGMRRGGRNYYAFDISDPDTPKKLWKSPIKGGDKGFEELGQTWSKPQIAYIKAWGDEPLLVFGAGYDTSKDNIRDADTMGRDVYIVKAKTGEKVWSLRSDNAFKGKHSIAADVSLLDSDYDGYIDRIYAADTGGGVWRIDMPGTSTNAFSHYKLAELGADTDRRFFYKPVVARTVFSKVTISKGVTSRLDTPYDAVLIGSGNRSNPLNSNSADQLFMVRDENTITKSFKNNAPAAIVPNDLMSMNEDLFGKALNNVGDFNALEAQLSNDFKGWRYKLNSGEKSLAAATVVGGVAYFTSFTPGSTGASSNQCSLGAGGGSLYAFHLHYGTKVYDNLKFKTSYEMPDTPQLYFGDSCADGNSDGKCDDNTNENVKSQFYLIGPGINGSETANPLKPLEITGPGLKVVDKKIQLVNDDSVGFGFRTQQTYIYKREENDEGN